MHVWINGTFGVGKTTTARILADELDYLLFDPERVGFLLRKELAGYIAQNNIRDFQQLRAWRELVPMVARSIADQSQQRLIFVQSVLNESIWAELVAGLQAQNMAALHVVLECDAPTMRRRIKRDMKGIMARRWRLDHLDDYRASRPWMVEAADLVVDTTQLGPKEAAAAIAQVIAA